MYFGGTKTDCSVCMPIISSFASRDAFSFNSKLLFLLDAPLILFDFLTDNMRLIPR